MHRATQQIDAKHRAIHDLQGRLRDRMVELSTRWHGQASNEFQRGYREFDTEFEKVKAGLDTIHTQLVQTLQGYRVGEDENKAIANKIKGLIGG